MVAPGERGLRARLTTCWIVEPAGKIFSSMFDINNIRFLLCLFLVYPPVSALRAQTNLAADNPNIFFGD